MGWNSPRWNCSGRLAIAFAVAVPSRWNFIQVTYYQPFKTRIHAVNRPQNFVNPRDFASWFRGDPEMRGGGVKRPAGSPAT